MAEEGIKIQTGQPIMAQAADGKVYLVSPSNPIATAAGGGTAYETVAASQTNQVMGGTGAAGDYLAGVLIVPATTGAGTVSIKDGSGSAINIFVTGTLADLKPFYVPIGAKSTGGAWSITTGANVSAIGFGAFSA